MEIIQNSDIEYIEGKLNQGEKEKIFLKELKIEQNFGNKE